MFALQHSKLYDAFSQKKLQFPFYGRLAATHSHQGTPSSFAAFSSKKRQIPNSKKQHPPSPKNQSPDLNLRKAQDRPHKLSTQTLRLDLRLPAQTH